MTCYVVPLAAFLVHKILKNKISWLRDDAAQRQLSLLLLGGSIFGIVDHAWNKELFYSANGYMYELALGAVITISIVSMWACILAYQHIVQKTAQKA